ncbi:PatA/PatG family cyanobactin maturation protease [Microseira wollei]|uniref:Peptidase S8 and S53, subtilisin, kexin, sedolisin n=1 Tax=Microseira wollei NIES-4236 TaxID=2530354 RepID=A0AAV3XQ49_9CYAN|nr:peptidase S8 and S53, subtilisin, kexin, sedolisin [Microseira wollei NIES-4236]
MPDLIAIPGIPELWTHTKGDPRITIAILDGSADIFRACFQGANLTRLQPYWQEEPAPIEPQYVELFWQIEALEKQKADLKKELKNNSDDTDSEELDEHPAVQALKQEVEALQKQIPEPILKRLQCDFHATHIISTIVGQHGSRAPGIAPNCRAFNIPIDTSGVGDEFISPLNLSRAFNLALDLGANIIHCAACHPTQTGIAHDLIARAVRQCQDNNILVVAPGGNDKGECWCIPAVLGGVLTVGAMRDDEQPFKFSNYGGNYESEGVLAFGENILGAQPGTDEPARKKGTSCAAPIVTGTAALLMSVQLQRGEKPNAEAIRTAILNSAIPCNPEEVEEPERCLRGKLNIPGAFGLLTGELLTRINQPEINPVVVSGITRAAINLATSVTPSDTNRAAINLATSVTPANTTRPAINFHLSYSESPLKRTENITESRFEPTLAMSGFASKADSTDTNQPDNLELSAMPSYITADGVTPSQKSNLVYALGTLGYDFGTEARRDTFKQLMPGVNIDGTLIPANPYDARQMVDYLGENLSEAKALIWTLNIELTPVYAIEPVGAFAADIYETLQLILAGQVQPEDREDYIERASIPGKLTDRTVKLFSGQVVPVISVQNTRGMYGWKVNTLVNSALQTVRSEAGEANEEGMRRSLGSFLKRIYFDLRNLGQTSRDRARGFCGYECVSSSFYLCLCGG